MSDPEQLYCKDPDCRDPENPDFPRPVFRLGLCQTHAKQQQRTGKTTAIAEKVSDEEKLTNLHDALMNAGDDDAEYERARRAYKAEQRRQVEAEVHRRIGDAQPTEEQIKAIRQEALHRIEDEDRKRRAAAVRQGHARAREQGRHIGRPPRVQREEVLRLLEALKKPALVAKVLGVSDRTVRRARRLLK